MNILKTKMNKTERKTLFFMSFLAFAMSLIVFITAYPILDSGIQGWLSEDTLYTYNFTGNITGSTSGSLVFSIEAINSSLHSSTIVADYFWISINSSTGIMKINSTKDNETGNFIISIHVLDSSNQGTTVASNFTVNATNDAPTFGLDANYTARVILNNQSSNLNLTGSDEEKQYPLVYNVSFNACDLASWSSRRGSPNNCNLSYQIINSSNITSILNFTSLTRDEVGIYNLTICVHDNLGGAPLPSYRNADYNTNKTACKNTTFVVEQALSINVSDCNNKNLQENQSFSCIINVTTKGQADNLLAWSNASLRNTGANAANSSWFFLLNNSNSSSFTQSYYVNVTPQKREIGNWTINFTIQDRTTGENSTTSIFIYANRTLSSFPSISTINNLTTSINLQNNIYFNVSDDDLLIPDKAVYDETISLTWSILNASNLIQQLNLSNFSIISSGTGLGVSNNLLRAKIGFMANSSEAGEYTVNLTASDLENTKSYSVFNLTILNNNAPVWNDSLTYNFSIWENNNTYVNLSGYVSDSQGDTLTFSFTNDTSFYSFNITSSTGIINFTARDEDVGQHLVNITVSDGYLTSIREFNFTIYNINDNPTIDSLENSGVLNASVDVNSNINASEDNLTTIILWIYDEDTKIPLGQNSFYNESFTLNLTIEGNNTLFSFTNTFAFPTSSFPNKTEYKAIFTPYKANVGSYNVSLNVTDKSNSSIMLYFNLTIFSVGHIPSLTSVLNQTASVTRTFNYNFSANDIEDGNSSKDGNYNFTFSLNDSNGILNFNSTNFNSTTGRLIVLFNSSQAGTHLIYLNVTDKDGMKSNTNFWLKVYDYPNITFPNALGIFSASENSTFNFTFAINHSVRDSLNYSFYLSSVLLNNSYNICNGSNRTFYFIPNFTQESYGDYSNFSLNVFNQIYPELNYTSIYYFNISHTNYLLENYLAIPNSSSSLSITLSLKSYFEDIDANDARINQTIKFNYTLINLTSGSISVTVNDWINGSTPNITFSSSSSSSGIYSIIGYEYNESNSSQIINNVTSNNFSIQLNTAVVSTPVSTSSSGGGGGGSHTNVIKIIVAPGVVMEKKDYIEVPFEIENLGTTTLSNINLYSFFSSGLLDNTDLKLSKNFIKELKPKTSENISLYITTNTQVTGDYLITISANVSSPKVSDWASFYLSIVDSGANSAEKLVLFTEKLVVENIECLELKEIVQEAKQLLQIKDYEGAIKKSQEAIDACKTAMSKNSQIKSETKYASYLYYFVFTFFMFLIFLIYIFYKRVRFKNKFSSNLP